MKRTINPTTVTENPNISWGALVGRLEMGAVLTALIEGQAYGFNVENDFGGSGTWRIQFHTDYDKPELVKMLGPMADRIDWFEVEA